MNYLDRDEYNKYKREQFRKISLKFCSILDIDIERFIDTFYYWDIFNSILDRYTTYNTMSYKQYNTLKKYIEMKLELQLPDYTEFVRKRYSRESTTQTNKNRHNWSKNVPKIDIYDLPLNNGYIGNIEILEIINTQCIIRVLKSDNIYKIPKPIWTKEIGKYTIRYKRTKYKGYLIKQDRKQDDKGRKEKIKLHREK